VTHQGQHFNLDSAFIMPRPVQGHLPLFIGGYNKRAFRRAALYGDGFLVRSNAILPTRSRSGPVAPSLRARFGEIGFGLYVSRGLRKSRRGSLITAKGRRRRMET